MQVRGQKTQLQLLLLTACCCTVSAGIFPLTLLKPEEQPTNQLDKLGYIEYQPNGTLILRSIMENGTNVQNLLLFRSVLQAMRLAPAPASTDSALSITINGIKMYGEGVEHKFPPFLERVLQRIQTFFSVYRYADTSRPVQPAVQQPLYTQRPTTVAATTTTATTIQFATTTGIDDKLESTTFQDNNTDEYTEFISIGENDGFIGVGED